MCFLARAAAYPPVRRSSFAIGRYIVEARLYLRQNLDILIDTLDPGLFHPTAPPVSVYPHNAKVYHANGLKRLLRLNIRLSPPGHDPAPGGLIERFLQTAQDS